MEYLPDSNARYKDVDYWNERYRTEESFEWFGDLTKFDHLLKQHVGTEENILMLVINRRILVERTCLKPYVHVLAASLILHVCTLYVWEAGKQSPVGDGLLRSISYHQGNRASPSVKLTFPGCGNSALSYDMYRAGYTSITNVDYSSVCVESMAERHKDCAQLSWLCMDARRLAFPDGVFDVVLEKGTLDAMLVEESDPWKGVNGR
ncbi:hypothetical protein cypCar_00032480 [Cyprinus carpio]|nr:hypothetical protein cypCar_00032480 [Cyprinus carpio]